MHAGHIFLFILVSKIYCSTLEDIDVSPGGSLYDLRRKAISEVSFMRSATTELRNRFSLFSQLINTTLAVRVMDLRFKLTYLLERDDMNAISEVHDKFSEVTSPLSREVLQMITACHLDTLLQNLDLELRGNMTSLLLQLAAIQQLLPNITDTFWSVQRQVTSTAGHIKAVTQEILDNQDVEDFDVEDTRARLISVLSLLETERVGQEIAKLAMDECDVRVQSSILSILSYITP